MSPRPKPLLERLEDKILVADGCWEWDGSRNAGGYGQLSVDGRNRMAHRVVYELLVGPIPDGMQIDHLCKTRQCVNPGHMEVVTCRENLMRGDTIQAENAGKTHCRHGHEFTPENTYAQRGHNRACRICLRVSYARYDAKRRKRVS